MVWFALRCERDHVCFVISLLLQYGVVLPTPDEKQYGNVADRPPTVDEMFSA